MRVAQKVNEIIMFGGECIELNTGKVRGQGWSCVNAAARYKLRPLCAVLYLIF